jgi:hypothetical protein
VGAVFPTFARQRICINNAHTPIGLLFLLGLSPFAWKFLLNRVADVANAIRGNKKRSTSHFLYLLYTTLKNHL